MTTTTLGKIIPSFLEEFGPGKNVDLLGSMSLKAVNSQLDDQVQTGFLIEKNGNFKFILNFYVEIIVENKDPEVKTPFIKARKVVIGVTFKGKISLQDVSPEEKALLVIPKGAEATTIKITKPNGE